MPKPYFQNKKQSIDSMIRVDHAGEYGAVRIYEGQIAAVRNDTTRNIMVHMLEQEKRHFQFFNHKMKAENIRPTIFMPLWNVAGFVLGFSTSFFGTKTAMLCTEAVETVIDEHYSDQIIDLKNAHNQQELVDTIDRYRLEELEHKDIASQYSNYTTTDFLFKKVIGVMCKLAIAVSKW